MTTVPSDDRALGIYLNDHLAGATAGTELAKRLAGEHRDHPSQVLERLVVEVAEDRDTLVSVMATLGIPRRHYKILLGWLGEKAGRLKPNGRVVARTRLSRVVGLETMRLGIEGKAAVWRTLRARADSDSRLDAGLLDGLLDRARQQAEQVERLRMRAATEAFGGDPLKTTDEGHHA